MARFPPKNVHKLWFADFYEDGTEADPYHGAQIRIGRFSEGVLSIGLMSPYAPPVYDLLSRVVEEVPEIATWKLDFDNGLDSTVGEYLDAGRPSEEGELPPVLFHGTSTAVLNDIKRHGIAPRRVTGTVPVFGAEVAGVGCSDRVYLASGYALGPAKFAAADAARVLGGDPIVLAVDADALDPQRLSPDEDSGREDWVGSMWVMGTMSYRGVIPPEAVTLAFERCERQWCEVGESHAV